MRQARAQALLDFWFGAPGDPDRGKSRRVWFERDAGFDEACRAQFEADLEAAARGEWDELRSTPEGALALTVLFDQIPRNIFRGSARAFATDPLARAVADEAIRRGLDVALPPVMRRFLYLPFEHSEDLDDQRRSVELVASCADDEDGASFLDYARRHLAVIERFGRFPHRNRVLGRASTAEEEEFLAAGRWF